MRPIHLLRPDQHEPLRALVSAVAAMPDFPSASRLLVERIEALLNVAAALIEWRTCVWHVVCAAGAATPADHLAHLAPVEASGDTIVRTDDAGPTWTVLPLHASGGGPSRRLLISGDWTPSQPALQEAAFRLGDALHDIARPRRAALDRRRAMPYALARRLARAVHPAQLHQTIVDACAIAAGAGKGSLALVDADRKFLSVVATYGYPSVLVRHMRFGPGQGIIGRVFCTGRSLRVGDVRRMRDAPPPRLRYRTAAFMSVPLSRGGQVRGVISVADPREGDQFSRQDLRTFRAMAGVALLALDRLTALEQASAAAHAAAIDPLTGLFNRRHFLTRLHEEVQRARRQLSPLAVMMIDVDQFKQLNDRLGHLAGDAVLRVVGDVLHRSVRLFDVCARQGGDEFAILMPGSSPEDSRQIAERIRSGIEHSRPQGVPWSDEARLTVSIGIAAFANTTSDDLIDRADRALYAAKRQGRNRVCEE